MGEKAKRRKTINNMIARTLCGDPQVATVLPAPETVFASVCDLVGAKALVRIRGDIVGYASKDALEDSIDRYHRFILPSALKDGVSLMQYSVADAGTIAYLVRASSPIIDLKDVKRIAEKSYDGLCFHRLDFDLDVSGETPVFNEMFGRMSNGDAVMAWIGGLFDDASDRAQILFLYGPGGNGKGRLINFMQETFGPTCAPTNVGAAKGAHWMETIHDKRLITFGECDDFSFATGDLMKGVTGDDRHMVNPKGVSAFTSEVRFKVLIASNVRPAVKSIESNRRRLIYSEIEAIAGEYIGEREYAEMLRREGPAFLTRCWRKYQELCPRGGAVPVDQGVYQVLVDEQESEFASIVERYFVLNDHLYAHTIDISTLFKNKNLFKGNHRGFIAYLDHKHGVKYGQIKLATEEGKPQRFAKGYKHIGLRGDIDGCPFKSPPLPAAYKSEASTWGKLLIEWGYSGVINADTF